MCACVFVCVCLCVCVYLHSSHKLCTMVNSFSKRVSLNTVVTSRLDHLFDEQHTDIQTEVCVCARVCV